MSDENIFLREKKCLPSSPEDTAWDAVSVSVWTAVSVFQEEP